MAAPMWIVCAILLATAAVAQANAWRDPTQPTKCPPGFFNFGDSLTDTGGALNAFPYETDAEFRPYGEKFFGKPAKRFSNGRLLPDFFSLAFGKPLLNSYFQIGAFDYRNGVNFAVAGSTASNDTTKVPFFLAFQAAHFLRFKKSVISVKNQIACSEFQAYLPEKSLFKDALYTITIGGNDISFALSNGKTAAEIVGSLIPQSITNYKNAIKTLHTEGARRFLIFNLPPVGCSAIILTLFGGLGLPSDDLGCVAPVNQLDQVYNSVLNQTIQEMRTTYPSATFSMFDYYSANIEILKNPTKYGFNPSKTLSACCGAPGIGAFNYNPTAPCGRANATKCSNPDEYVNWDGVHFTDTFYKQIATWALAGKFTDVPINYRKYCGLNLSRFGDKVTYDQVYSGRCNVLSGDGLYYQMMGHKENPLYVERQIE